MYLVLPYSYQHGNRGNIIICNERSSTLYPTTTGASDEVGSQRMTTYCEAVEVRRWASAPIPNRRRTAQPLTTVAASRAFFLLPPTIPYSPPSCFHGRCNSDTDAPPRTTGLGLRRRQRSQAACYLGEGCVRGSTHSCRGSDEPRARPTGERAHTLVQYTRPVPRVQYFSPTRHTQRH